MGMNFEYKSQAIDWIVDNLDSINSWTNHEEFHKARQALGPDFAKGVIHIISQNKSEQARKLLRKIQGDFALEENNTYLAQIAFVELDDKVGLRKTIESGLQHGYEYDALLAYLHLKEPQYLKEVVNQIIKSDRTDLLEELVKGEINQELHQSFVKFWKKRKFPMGIHFNNSEAINAAYNLIPQYDIGVGVAKGGLFSSYLFGLMGLPVVLCEAHRRGRGATFKWHHSPKRLKGKKVLVFDKDAVTGRTLRRTVREILPYNPKKLGIFFNHDKPYLHLKAVPQEFEDVNHPEKMNYTNFYQAYMKFKENFDKKK